MSEYEQYLIEQSLAEYLETEKNHQILQNGDFFEAMDLIPDNTALDHFEFY